MSCILSAGNVTLPEEFAQQQIRLDLGVRSVEDVVIVGRITDCETNEPIVGAIVKVFHKNDEGDLIDLCHTFSGYKGYYMLNLPKEFEGKTITVMAACSNCLSSLEPCLSSNELRNWFNEAMDSFNIF